MVGDWSCAAPRWAAVGTTSLSELLALDLVAC